uniref:uncharacterized protein LOC122779330 isoform X2 n=1 Tax=Solea senegalensis TaxID=28829 RepID=UPI001CD81FEA|nr:uncharacterized protein LOC122779330 isoform X2 [Solea senegalensis]XP_043897463.1 uncharacterized protein LOC122779330 isoform X2 [Solea senegalensis]XP_043897464.1 uncharacterized protein LOC122779330 isoform X2 [Solea senegalensis]XP_043897465.1 uncharacterized protein LOC122779330 isoform X2 [Solea senegalensis]
MQKEQLKKNGQLIKLYHMLTCMSIAFLCRGTVHMNMKWVHSLSLLFVLSIDASREDNSLGRLVNDQHKGPNCRMKKIDVDGKPHLCLFAIKDINEGEEITYDYGGDDCPWRIQASTHAEHEPFVDGAHADVPSGPQVDDDAHDITSNEHSNEQIVTNVGNEDGTFVPKLRRTKSIIMEKTDFEDPDELYDSTSSGDEYVPDSTTESDDSDFNLTSVIGTKPWPLTELCHDSESESYPPVCDTTTPHLESLRYNSSTSDISVNEEPCSSQDAIDTIVVQASQKRNGNRVYNKKQYCLYCKKAYAKMARHLERAHHNKLYVAKALSLPKGSLERKKQQQRQLCPQRCCYRVRERGVGSI